MIYLFITDITKKELTNVEIQEQTASFRIFARSYIYKGWRLESKTVACKRPNKLRFIFYDCIDYCRVARVKVMDHFLRHHNIKCLDTKPLYKNHLYKTFIQKSFV